MKMNHQRKVIFFLFFIASPSSFSPSPIRFLRYSLTFPSFSLITLSTYFMNFLASPSSHSPSLKDIWFSDITSNDRFEIVFRRFLLSAKANSPFAARLTLII